MKNKTKIIQLAVLIIICALPLILSTGCGGARAISCAFCGSSHTYTPVYASGATANSRIEYSSCVCPAGCIGCGCSTACWPTECLSVKFTDVSGADVNGTVLYYDGCGCLDNKNSMSTGCYTQTYSCLGVACSSSRYTESITSDGYTASETVSCFGCFPRDDPTELKGYNDIMPRQYPYGCYTIFHEEENN